MTRLVLEPFRAVTLISVREREVASVRERARERERESERERERETLPSGRVYTVTA